MSSWVNIPAAFAMPVFFAVLSLTTAPMGRQRSYLLLIAFALATCFLGIVSEVLLTPLFRDLSGSTFEAVSAGFAGMAIPEQGAKVGGFWLWLVFVRDRQQRDAIVGAVSTAMLFEAMQNSIIFHDALSDAETWGQTVALRSLIIVSLSALSAFVIGIWTALSLRQAFGKWAAYAGGAFFLVVATDGIWKLLFSWSSEFRKPGSHPIQVTKTPWSVTATEGIESNSFGSPIWMGWLQVPPPLYSQYPIKEY